MVAVAEAPNLHDDVAAPPEEYPRPVSSARFFELADEITRRWAGTLEILAK